MRINLTNKIENQNVEQIIKIVNEAFSSTEYKVKVVPYDYEKSRKAHRNYYINNIDRIKKYHQEYAKKKKAEKLLKDEPKEVATEKIPKAIKPSTKITNNEIDAKDLKTKTESVKNKKS